MKKLLTTLLFIFALTTSNAQQQFEGEWKSETSSFTTTIIASEYAVLKVFNFSFKEDLYIEETILKQTDHELTTRLYNYRNGYDVVIKYKLIAGNLICEFSGDLHTVIKLTKK